MKFVKGISLFFIGTCFGICMGVMLYQYFYPGRNQVVSREESGGFGENIGVVQVSSEEKEVLSADTEYIIEEYDTRRDSLVETSLKVPAKYLGMDRESFEKVMEVYALSPPLSELERGFVSLEIRSFSKERVVVRMNYSYVEPSLSFYLMVEDSMIVVYCEDKKTVYQYTDISADALPENVLIQVIMGMYIQDEAQLYQFLETYSS